MATELIDKEVDGQKYEFEQLGAKDSLKTLMKLSKIVGRPFIMSIGASQGKGKPLNTELLAQAAGILFQSLEETETLNIIESLTAKKALCDGKMINFDSHYSGKIDHLFRVLNAALEVQYGNFFAAVTGFLDSGSPVQAKGTIPASQT